jgi:hypothetical protein
MPQHAYATRVYTISGEAAGKEIETQAVRATRLRLNQDVDSGQYFQSANDIETNFSSTQCIS